MSELAHHSGAYLLTYLTFVKAFTSTQHNP